MRTKIKSEIKKAITENSKYKAVKVWSIKVDEYVDGPDVMWIEVTVQKKKKKA